MFNLQITLLLLLTSIHVVAAQPNYSQEMTIKGKRSAVMGPQASSPAPSESTSRRAQQLEPFILGASQPYGIYPRLLRTICFLESRYRLDAISGRGARGPMQLMPDTTLRYGVRNPHDPRQAFDAAARYLHDLLKRFSGRVDLVLAAYNAGEGTVEAFRSGKSLMLPGGKIINSHGFVTGGIPPYAETRKYVRIALLLLHRTMLNTNAQQKLPTKGVNCFFIEVTN